MKRCPQTETQSVYQHGFSVADYTARLLDALEYNDNIYHLRLPDWFSQYRIQIMAELYSYKTIFDYAKFHDCGKPYCIEYDSEGKRHFPNHAEVSYGTWMSISDDEIVGNLIRNDMMIHQIKAADIDEFIKNPGAITLLIVGLAEVHSNAQMFGGLESDSFKIKWKQINKRGKDICQKLFKGK
jgi:hypothetical protein